MQPGSAQAGTGAAGRALLPIADEPNSNGLQLARSSDGALHAADADIAGRVFYARCEAGCGNGGGWREIIVATVDVGNSGYAVPWLKLDRRDRPRVALHVAPGVFDPGTTWFAECDLDCLGAGGWRSAAVIGHVGSLLEAQLTTTDWFALDPDGRGVIALLLENGLLDTDRGLRLLSCEAACTTDGAWSERVVETGEIVSSRPVDIEIDTAGRIHLVVNIETIGADVGTLTWLGCDAGCLVDGAWSDPVALQQVETDLDSLPDAALAVASDGIPAVLSFDDADRTSLTLHICTDDCAQPSGWVQQELADRLSVPGGMYGAGYGVDARFDDEGLQIVYAAKAADAPLRQPVVSSVCAVACDTAAGEWNSRVMARTDERLDDQGICLFIGTVVASGVSAVTDAAAFTASPQWPAGPNP